MKTIKIFFTDFWSEFDKENNFITNTLRDSYNIIVDAVNPDYLFYSYFGFNHFNYPSAIKIYFTGENDVPDFNLCDYAMGPFHISFEDRYYHLPLYQISNGYKDIFSKSLIPEKLLNRKFCNFIYSNGQLADPIRTEFFHKLSEYKKVDSGGRYLNNIDRAIEDKIQFISEYKFTIAFENCSLSGYTTEKLIDPMRVNSLPIYWGNPTVEKDFNADSFIFVNNYGSLEEAINEVIYLDNNDEAYLEKMDQPWINSFTEKNWEDNFLVFLSQIIEQDISKAKRTNTYGILKRYNKVRKREGNKKGFLKFPLFKKRDK